MQVEINGARKAITSAQLFQMAASGEIGPKTRLWLDGKETTCDNVSGIRFGAPRAASPPKNDAYSENSPRVERAVSRKDPRVVKTQFLDYYIGGGSTPYVVCFLDPGRSVYSSNGGRVWLRGPIETQTSAEGGLFRSLGRLAHGESFFISKYVAQGPAEIAFSTKCPGAIVPKVLAAGESLVCQKGAFLAATPGVNLSLFFQKSLGAGFFAGEGFIMQKVEGPGVVFLELDGAAYEYDLAAGEQITCDTGALAWADATCSVDVVWVKGLKNMFLGGEGFFDTVITGPGKVTLQSTSLQQLATAVATRIPPKS
ncbi:MAG: AIM24 family protein [Thermoguttaceae bacterium]|nr:AIM24 family protein [Thermoguttaceae bacterium]